MYLFYLDGSADHHYYAFSAIGIPEQYWREVFEQVKCFRLYLRKRYGILLARELHATKFLSGRGHPSPHFLSKATRASIYNQALRLLSSFASVDVILFNAAMNNEDRAFERLLNRVNRTMQARKTKAMLFCDEGAEGHYTRLCRRLAAHNPIRSKYGEWKNGKEWKSIPTEHILEDPVFKTSHGSNFIQLADLCAFALLRMDRPTAPMTALGIHQSFEILEPVCFKRASPRDRFGVSR